VPREEKKGRLGKRVVGNEEMGGDHRLPLKGGKGVDTTRDGYSGRRGSFCNPKRSIPSKKREDSGCKERGRGGSKGGGGKREFLYALH